MQYSSLFSLSLASMCLKYFVNSAIAPLRMFSGLVYPIRIRLWPLEEISV